MRGAVCVGVIAGIEESATLIVEVSGKRDSVTAFEQSVPVQAASFDDWFESLEDLLPMTYRFEAATPLTGATIYADTRAAAEAMASDHIAEDDRTSKLVTSRVTVTATISEDAGQEAALSDQTEADESPVSLVTVPTTLDRPLLSVSDDGAGLLASWFLLLEDWQGFAAIFAGDRDTYAVLARGATEDMSRQIAGAVPSEAANLEHWVTSLIRKLPAGVWLRTFADPRSITSDTLDTPKDILTAAIGFYGTPSPERDIEFYGAGEIDGSLRIEENGESRAGTDAAKVAK